MTCCSACVALHTLLITVYFHFHLNTHCVAHAYYHTTLQPVLTVRNICWRGLLLKPLEQVGARLVLLLVPLLVLLLFLLLVLLLLDNHSTVCCASCINQTRIKRVLLVESNLKSA